MSCSRRNALKLLAAAPLGACGFQPLYGEGTVARNLNGLIDVPILPGRFGFDLRQRLITRLGRAQAPQFMLGIQTDIQQESRAILSDNTITRFTLTAHADYEVIPIGRAQAVFRDRERAVTGYSTVASPFATRAAEIDAFRRLAVSLAESMVVKLASTSRDWAA